MNETNALTSVGGHHGRRNARQYRSPDVETLLRNHDVRRRERGWKAIGALGQTRADELVNAAVDGAINVFDTADNYTVGESEKTLGQSLKNLNIARKEVVIATEVYSWFCQLLLRTASEGRV